MESAECGLVSGGIVESAECGLVSGGIVESSCLRHKLSTYSKCIKSRTCLDNPLHCCFGNHTMYVMNK